MLRLVLLLACLLVPIASHGQALRYPPKPYPEVDDNTVVLIEIWPEVGDITFHAYFMDCAASEKPKFVPVRRTGTRPRRSGNRKGTEPDVYQLSPCLTLPQAGG